MTLVNLALLVRIVEKRGLAAAGRELGLSPATVSERLSALEAQYGVKLLHRTTRSLSLTDEGRLLVDGARRLLAEADDLETRIRHSVEKLSGNVRVSAPIDLGKQRLAPLLDAFMAKHPGIHLDLRLHDGYVDLIGTGIDLALRFGNLKDSRLQMRRIGMNRRVVCAAPSYLKKYGVPNTPEDLGQHNCILMRFGESIDHEWSFVVKGKSIVQIVRGNRIANDGALAREWSVQGHGIVLKSIWDVGGHLEKGELVELLAGYAPPPSSLQVVYSSGRNLPRRVRALIDFLAEHMTLPSHAVLAHRERG